MIYSASKMNDGSILLVVTYPQSIMLMMDTSDAIGVASDILKVAGLGAATTNIVPEKAEEEDIVIDASYSEDKKFVTLSALDWKKIIRALEKDRDVNQKGEVVD